MCACAFLAFSCVGDSGVSITLDHIGRASVQGAARATCDRRFKKLLGIVDDFGDFAAPVARPTVTAPNRSRAALRSLYWMNLASRVDKRAQFESMLSRGGVRAAADATQSFNVSRVEALNGWHMFTHGTLESRCGGAVDLASLHDIGSTAFVEGEQLTAGSAAHVAGMRSLLQRIALADETAVSCEDDAVFVDADSGTRLDRLMRVLDNSTASWDVMLLGYHVRTSAPLGPEVLVAECQSQPTGCGAAARAGELRARRVTGHFFGSFAFAIRRGSAAYLLRALFPSKIQFDSQLSQAAVKGVSAGQM